MPATVAARSRHPLLDWPALSADYASYHRAPGNRFCHAFGIPLIVFAVVAWTRLPGGFPLAALVLPVYLAWDLRIAAGMGLAVGAFAVLAQLAPWWGAGAAFVLGWTLQLVGHQVFEKQSPAFLRNLAHLLVGPAWLVEKVLRASR